MKKLLSFMPVALSVIITLFILAGKTVDPEPLKPIAKYNAVLVDAVDGDTLDLDVDIGFDLTLRGRFRILDLDTFEKALIRGTTPEEKKKGIAAKEYAARILRDKPIRILIYSWKKDPYGRWLCSINIDGKDFATIMKKQGFQKEKK